MLNSDREYIRSQHDNQIIELLRNADTTKIGLILRFVSVLLSLCLFPTPSRPHTLLWLA
jgi:hypothetical protein